MAILNLNPETLLISSDDARKAAEQYAREYQEKQPYRNHVIDTAAYAA